MVENVNPKAGKRATVVIAVIGAVVLLLLLLFYWQGAWRDTGPVEEQPVGVEP